jgi:anti-sigma factor RsiW
MNCRDIAELLPLHSCGELGPAREVDFATHLVECPKCAEVVKRQEYYDARLRAIVLSDDTSDTDAAAERVNQKVRLQIASSSTARVTPFPSASSASSASSSSFISMGTSSGTSSGASSRARRITAAAMGIAALLIFAMLGYHGLFSQGVARVYADAAQDHQLEVVEQQPRRWLTDPEKIALLGSRVGVPHSAVLGAAPSGYRLVRGKICVLDSYVYLHLVYSDGTREFSLYLRPRGVGQLPRATREAAQASNGTTIGECGVGSDHVAAFETPRLTVLLVTDQPAATGASLAQSIATAL